jgi:hypothetical protein
MIKSRKYQLPPSLAGQVSQGAYDRWLGRKAKAHVKRDRKRKNNNAKTEEYKIAIHKAVVNCRGRDVYTGEKLRWERISKYDNTKAKLGRRVYKAEFALLPTVDHLGDGSGPADFAICAWRTNDAKGDLTYRDFVSLCRRVIKHRQNKAVGKR